MTDASQFSSRFATKLMFSVHHRSCGRVEDSKVPDSAINSHERIFLPVKDENIKNYNIIQNDIATNISLPKNPPSLHSDPSLVTKQMSFVTQQPHLYKYTIPSNSYETLPCDLPTPASYPSNRFSLPSNHIVFI